MSSQDVTSACSRANMNVQAVTCLLELVCWKVSIFHRLFDDTEICGRTVRCKHHEGGSTCRQAHVPVLEGLRRPEQTSRVGLNMPRCRCHSVTA